MSEKKYGRLIVATMLGIALAAVTVFVQPMTAEAVSYENTIYENTIYENTIQEGIEGQNMTVEELCGHVDVPYTIYSIEDGAREINVLGETELPASYDAREYGKVTSVKRQNPWGNCWSFATMSALESSLISDGYDPEIDLSEYHLNYYCYKAVPDPLNGTTGDGFTYNGSLEKFLNAGGNILVSFHALTNWVGAVEEKMTGYPASDPEALEDTVESAYLNDLVHLQQMYQLSKEDREAVKKEIMEHGSLTASFYYAASYYNSSTGGYYNSVNTNANHAVAVVGWDDNFSKENFKNQPAADGAWLVKNSWGTSFGQDGYLWISYEDTSIGDAMCLLLAEDADNYDNNYQYDGSYMNTKLKAQETLMVSNIFQIQKGDTKEELKAVAFELGNTNVDYSIQIYKNLQEPDNPISGTPLLEEPVTGSTLYQGYYTVELPEPVLLNPGETFAVVITYKQDDYVYIVLEKSTVWNNIEFVATAKENQSFFSTDGGANWTDAGSKYKGNLRLKAFTNNTDLEPSQKVETVTVTPGELELAIGESGRFQAEVAPEDAENQAVIWNSSDEAVATVDEEGVVTAHKQGSAKIICASEDGGASASVVVNIRTPFTDIRTTDWQYPFVAAMYEQRIMIGKQEELFGTEDMLTRSEFVTVLYNYEGRPEPASGKIPFADVEAGKWYEKPIFWAAQEKITAGYGNIFGINDIITREQLVQMLYSYAISRGLVESVPEGELTAFADSAEVSSWAQEAMLWAMQNELIEGKPGSDGKLLADPQGGTTRGECATIMMKWLNKKAYSTN